MGRLGPPNTGLIDIIIITGVEVSANALYRKARWACPADTSVWRQSRIIARSGKLDPASYPISAFHVRRDKAALFQAQLLSSAKGRAKEGQRQTQAAGHLERAGSGLHDGGNASAGTDLWCARKAGEVQPVKVRSG